MPFDIFTAFNLYTDLFCFLALHNYSFKCRFAFVCVTLLLLTREAKKCKLVFSRYEATVHCSFATNVVKMDNSEL